MRGVRPAGAARRHQGAGRGDQVDRNACRRIQWEQGAALTEGVFGNVVMAMMVHAASEQICAHSSRTVTGVGTRYTEQATYWVRDRLIGRLAQGALSAGGVL